MVYVTTEEIINFSGLGLRRIDENVGTGDASETDFDLDFTNIIASTYSLYHGASGSNTMTALTETTHYTLDKESGRVVLTGTGVSAVGTDIIYATYTYTEIFSDSILSSFVTFSDSEVEKLTGRSWDTPSSVTEYLNGRSLSGYPSTDRPYANDWEQSNYVVLRNHPVTQVNSVFFLQTVSVSQFWNYDDGTAVYTDYTDNCNSLTSDDFTLFDASPGVSDIIYIGSANKFLGLHTNLTTLGTGSPVIDWEYWNGTAWSDLTESETDSGSSTFEASGRFTWSLPSNWDKTTVNSSSSLYFVRGKLTTGYTIDPICHNLAIYDAINDELHPRNIKYETWGKLWFVDKSIPDGTQNVRVNYAYGASSVPALVTELSAILVSIRCYVNLSGGSYDDATSYTLGSKQISIGEVYVNIREVLSQFKNRKNEILDLLGRRAWGKA